MKRSSQQVFWVKNCKRRSNSHNKNEKKWHLGSILPVKRVDKQALRLYFETGIFISIAYIIH
jgi:hypothetical protein